MNLIFPLLCALCLVMAFIAPFFNDNRVTVYFLEPEQPFRTSMIIVFVFFVLSQVAPVTAAYAE